MKRKGATAEALHLHDVALHEAAHAVVGIHLRLSVKGASLFVSAGSQPNRKDAVGAVNISLEFLFCPFRRVFNGTEFIKIKTDVEKLTRQLMEKVIVMAYAGAIAKYVFGEETPSGALSDKEDRRMIRDIQRQFAISHDRLQILRKRAEKIIRTPFIKEAILNVAFDLENEKTNTLSAAKIRKHYRSAFEAKEIEQPKLRPRVRSTSRK